MVQKPEQHSDLLKNIFYRQNCRYWNNENQHIVLEDLTQYPQKIHVYTGFLEDKICEPVFLNQNLSGDIFEDFLENTSDPLTVRVLEDQIDGKLQIDKNCFHIQLDGAPPHYALNTRQCLDQSYAKNVLVAEGQSSIRRI